MCSLEPSLDGTMMSSRPQQSQPGGPVKLEGADTMIVLFRVVNRQVERVRVFSEDCQLDAGGREITWLTGVKPAESVALLESLVAAQPSAERRDRIVDGSISAIALHEDASATAALERLLAASQPQQVRAKVPFWLGNTRGRRGLEILQRVVKEDPAVEVKKKAVFGISQSREPQAVDVLIENAKTNPDTAVRSESIFWLAQKGGKQGRRGDHRADRAGPGHRGEEEGRLRLEPAAEGRRRAPADPGGAHALESRGPETGDVLAGSVERPARAGIVRGDLEVVSVARTAHC